MDAREYTVVDDSGVLGKFSSMAKAKKFVVEKRSEGLRPRIRISEAAPKPKTAAKPKEKPKTAAKPKSRPKAGTKPEAGVPPKATRDEQSTEEIKKAFDTVMFNEFTGVMTVLMDRMDEVSLQDVINGKRKTDVGYSTTYYEAPETFTVRHVVEPILGWLGYTRLAYEVKVSTSSMRCDIGLILDGGEMVLVEVKPFGSKLTDDKKQLERYVKELDKKYGRLRKDVAILTDGTE